MRVTINARGILRVTTCLMRAGNVLAISACIVLASVAFAPAMAERGGAACSAGLKAVRGIALPPDQLDYALVTAALSKHMLVSTVTGVVPYISYLRDYLHKPNTPATRRLIQQEIENSVTRWEPRIQLQSVEVAPDPEDRRAAVATIAYRVIALRQDQEVNLRVKLTG